MHTRTHTVSSALEVYFVCVENFEPKAYLREICFLPKDTYILTGRTNEK